jgi:hypothetical protein
VKVVGTPKFFDGVVLEFVAFVVGDQVVGDGLEVTHAVDAVGGFILGVATGFAVSYAMARSIWNRFPLAYHIAPILIFAVLVFRLSERQRRAMVFTRSHS